MFQQQFRNILFGLLILLFSGCWTVTDGAPVNDDVCDASFLPTDGSLVPFNTTGATTESGEATGFIFEVTKSVWYKFQGPSEGCVTIKMDGDEILIGLGG